MEKCLKITNLRLFLALMMFFASSLFANNALAEKCSEAVNKIIPEIHADTYPVSSGKYGAAGDITFKWDFIDGAEKYIIHVKCGPKHEFGRSPNDVYFDENSYEIDGSKNSFTINDSIASCNGCEYTIQAKCCLDGCASKCDTKFAPYAAPETFCDGLEKKYPVTGPGSCFCQDPNFPWCDPSLNPKAFFFKKESKLDPSLVTGCSWHCTKGATQSAYSTCGIDYSLKCGNLTNTLKSDSIAIEKGVIKYPVGLCDLYDTQRRFNLFKYDALAENLAGNTFLNYPNNTLNKGTNRANLWRWTCQLDNGTPADNCQVCRMAECGSAYGQVYATIADFQKAVQADVLYKTKNPGYGSMFCNAATDNWLTASSIPVNPLLMVDNDNNITWDCIGDQACNKDTGIVNKNFAALGKWNGESKDPTTLTYSYKQFTTSGSIDKCRARIAACGTFASNSDNNVISQERFTAALANPNSLEICPAGAVPEKVLKNRSGLITDVNGVISHFIRTMPTGSNVVVPTYIEEGWEWRCKFTNPLGSVVYKDCVAYEANCQFNTEIKKAKYSLDFKTTNLTQKSYMDFINRIPLSSDVSAKKVDYFCRNGKTKLVRILPVSLVPDVLYTDPTYLPSSASNGPVYPGWKWQCLDNFETEDPITKAKTRDSKKSQDCFIAQTVCAEPNGGFASSKAEANAKDLCKNSNEKADIFYDYKLDTITDLYKIDKYKWLCKDDLGDGAPCSATKVDCSDKVKEVMENGPTFKLGKNGDTWYSFLQGINGSTGSANCTPDFGDSRQCTGLCNDPTVTTTVTYADSFYGPYKVWGWYCGEDDPFDTRTGLVFPPANRTDVFASRCEVINADCDAYTPDVQITAPKTICQGKEATVSAFAKCIKTTDSNLTWSSIPAGTFANPSSSNNEQVRLITNATNKITVKVDAVCNDICAIPKKASATADITITPNEEPEPKIVKPLDSFCESQEIEFEALDNAPTDKKCLKPEYTWFCKDKNGNKIQLGTGINLKVKAKDFGCATGKNTVYVDMNCSDAGECIGTKTLFTDEKDVTITTAETAPTASLKVEPNMCQVDTVSPIASSFSSSIADKCNLSWYRTIDGVKDTLNTLAGGVNYNFDLKTKDQNNTDDLWQAGKKYKLFFAWNCPADVCIDKAEGLVESNEFEITAEKKLNPEITISPKSPICAKNLPLEFKLNPDCRMPIINTPDWSVQYDALNKCDEAVVYNQGTGTYTVTLSNCKFDNPLVEAIKAIAKVKFVCKDAGCISREERTVVSSEATIEREMNPIVSIEPANEQTICIGSVVALPTYTSKLTDCLNPVYSWKNISGLAPRGGNSSYTPLENELSDGLNEFSLDVTCSNACTTKNTVSSNKVVLKAMHSPIVTAGDITADKESVCNDRPVVLTAHGTCANSSSTSYEWYQDGTEIAGENNSTLSISALAKTSIFTYKIVCSANDPCSDVSVVSKEKTIEVTDCTCGPANGKTYTNDSFFKGISSSIDANAGCHAGGVFIDNNTYYLDTDGSWNWKCEYLGGSSDNCKAYELTCGTEDEKARTIQNWNKVNTDVSKLCTKAKGTIPVSASDDYVKTKTLNSADDINILIDINDNDKNALVSMINKASDGVTYYDLINKNEWFCNGNGGNADKVSCSTDIVQCGYASAEQTDAHGFEIEPYNSASKERNYNGSFVYIEAGTKVANDQKNWLVNNKCTANTAGNTPENKGRGLYYWTCLGTDSLADKVVCSARMDCGVMIDPLGTAKRYPTIRFRDVNISGGANRATGQYDYCWTAEDVIAKSDNNGVITPTTDLYFNDIFEKPFSTWIIPNGGDPNFAKMFHGARSTSLVKPDNISGTRLNPVGVCDASLVGKSFVLPKDDDWFELEKYLSSNINCDPGRLNDGPVNQGYGCDVAANGKDVATYKDGLKAKFGFNASISGYWTASTEFSQTTVTSPICNQKATGTSRCGTFRPVLNGTIYCTRSPYYRKFNGSNQIARYSDYNLPIQTPNYCDDINLIPNQPSRNLGESKNKVRCIFNPSDANVPAIVLPPVGNPQVIGVKIKNNMPKAKKK